MNPLLFAFIIFIAATTASFYSSGKGIAGKIVGIVGIFALTGFIIWNFIELGVGYGIAGIIWAGFMYSAASKSHTS